ncbi:MAG: tetratricopeptide repeat protein [Deltaproteobacteria bacterium]|nr:tetratricopeptide repeat protein [Deltaproteobacteria bacterium]
MSRPTLRNTLRMAASAYAEQDFERARDAAATAVALSPDSVPAHHYLAASLAALGQPRAADRAFHEGLTLAPGDPELLLGLCDLLTGELSTDAPALEEALALGELGGTLAARKEDEGLTLEFALTCARALTSLGRPAEAVVRLAGFDAEENTDLHLQRGMAHFELGALEAAAECFDLALALEPDEALAHWYLGLIAEHLGESDEALRHAERARRLDPETFPTPFLSTTRTFEGAVERAIEQLAPAWKSRIRRFEIVVEALPPRGRLGPLSPLALWDLRETGEGQTIALFRRNLERGSGSLEALVKNLQRTLRRAIAKSGRPRHTPSPIQLYPAAIEQ